MGVNEHGVAIGNEGLHARSPAPQENALTGMDLLRLALERATTAAEALDVITALLRQYGQGGNCGHITPNYYNNGFMIADSTEALVLETVEREWLTTRVREAGTISNIYSIEDDADRVSAGLPALIRNQGWGGGRVLTYATAIGDPNREHIGQGGVRRARSAALLHSSAGQLRAADLMRILRDHGPMDRSDTRWNPQKALAYTVCMHAGSEERPGQTTGSLVSEISPKGSVHWVTGTAAPCISIFKPVLLDAMLPPHGPSPTDRFDARTLWWRHERLHRAVLRRGFSKFHDETRAERDALEAEFHARV